MVPQQDHTGILIGSAGNHSIVNKKRITQVIALADIAMMVPAVISLERDWLAPIYYLEVVLLSAIVAAAFVAVEHLHQITLSDETQ